MLIGFPDSSAFGTTLRLEFDGFSEFYWHSVCISVTTEFLVLQIEWKELNEVSDGQDWLKKSVSVTR